MFLIAHELYDALPIHQFKYLGNENWCEMSVQLKSQRDRQKQNASVLQLNLNNQTIQKADNIQASEADIVETDDDLVFSESAANSENVVKVLKPKKFFSKEAK